MQNRFLRSLSLLTFLGIFASSCEAPTDIPVSPSKPSFGAIANSNIGSHYYPRRTGLTYVYSNRVVTTSANGQSTVYGSNDTVRTLGFRGFAGNDSVFAVSITYQVAQRFAGRTISSLRYLPANSSFGGAYVDAATALQGELNTSALSTRATSTDSITAPTYGRMRSLASDFAGGTAIWQTDTIYYTSSPDHVAFYAKNAQGSYVHSKDLFRADIPVGNGYEWEYSVWQPNTIEHVINDNKTITVGSTSFNTIQSGFANSDLNAGSTSQKHFASGFGPVRQIESWFVTTDGVNRVNKQLIREGVVVLDWDEVMTL